MFDWVVHLMCWLTGGHEYFEYPYGEKECMFCGRIKHD